MTITSPYTGTVTSDAKYLAGGVTKAVVEITTSDTSGTPTTVTWKSDDTAVSISNNDVTVTPTVNNQGVRILKCILFSLCLQLFMFQPYKITCDYSSTSPAVAGTVTAATCTITAGGSDASCAALATTLTWSTLTDTTITSDPKFTGSGSASPSVDCSPYTVAIDVTSTVTGDNPANTDNSGSVMYGLASDPTISITNADATSAQDLDNLGVSLKINQI